jgi:hypothetical protein
LLNGAMAAANAGGTTGLGSGLDESPIAVEGRDIIVSSSAVRTGKKAYRTL